MVTPGEVRTYLVGVWMLARNDIRGFAHLDLTADGFWRSFAAIPYAVPAFLLSWLNYRDAHVEALGDAARTGAGFFLRLALIDILNWLVPILVVALVAAPLGLASNFGRWVIASNWLGLPMAYLTAIPLVMTMVMPGFAPIGAIVSLAFLALVVAAFFRVTRLSFDGDGTVALAITVGLVVLSIVMTGMLQVGLGLRG